MGLERRFKQIKSEWLMIWCQLSWLPRRTMESRKLLSPVSKVTSEHQESHRSLAIFPHLLILFLLLPSSTPLLHARSLGSTGCQGTKEKEGDGRLGSSRWNFSSHEFCPLHPAAEDPHTEHTHIPSFLFLPSLFLNESSQLTSPNQNQAALGHKYATGWRVRWMEGGIVGLPLALSLSGRRISSCSPAPVYTIIQAGLNPSSLPPSLLFSLHPSLSLSLSPTSTNTISLQLLSFLLWPTVFLVLLFFPVLFLSLCFPP